MAHKHKDTRSDCVSLDLFVGDEDDEPNSSQNVVETLCLRILSKSNIKYKFGGLQIHVKSPEFHIGKSFHVNLDENNRIDSIESYREPEDNYLFGRRRVSLLGSNNLSTMPARILITPKKPPETDPTSNNGTTSSSTTTNGQPNQTANNVTNNLSNRTPCSQQTLANKIGSLNQFNSGQIPILTADVVVEEILDTQDNQSQTSGQSLGTTIVNTLLNKRTVNHSNASSVGTSPSQSIHSINSLSSSMLELRSTSPINMMSTEKMISKLTLQAFGHLENKYIKHKSKKYDFKKRSKEKLLAKNGEKGDEKNGLKDSNKSLDKSMTKNADSQATSGKVDKTSTEKVHIKTTASDHNLAAGSDHCEVKSDKNSVETKSIGVCTHLDASNLSLNIPQGFFSGLRRTRSWKK